MSVQQHSGVAHGLLAGGLKPEHDVAQALVQAAYGRMEVLQVHSSRHPLLLNLIKGTCENMQRDACCVEVLLQALVAVQLVIGTLAAQQYTSMQVKRYHTTGVSYSSWYCSFKALRFRYGSQR